MKNELITFSALTTIMSFPTATTSYKISQTTVTVLIHIDICINICVYVCMYICTYPQLFFINYFPHQGNKILSVMGRGSKQNFPNGFLLYTMTCLYSIKRKWPHMAPMKSTAWALLSRLRNRALRQQELGIIMCSTLPCPQSSHHSFYLKKL